MPCTILSFGGEIRDHLFLRDRNRSFLYILQRRPDPKCFRYLCTEPEAAFSIRSRTPFSCCSAILIPVSIPADT